jgi:hypothetical protein
MVMVFNRIVVRGDAGEEEEEEEATGAAGAAVESIGPILGTKRLPLSVGI